MATGTELETMTSSAKRHLMEDTSKSATYKFQCDTIKKEYNLRSDSLLWPSYPNMANTSVNVIKSATCYNYGHLGPTVPCDVVTSDGGNMLSHSTTIGVI